MLVSNYFNVIIIQGLSTSRLQHVGVFLLFLFKSNLFNNVELPFCVKIIAVFDYTFFLLDI